MPPSAHTKLIVMGVTGCGKSSLGRALAQALGATYLEGDDLHPPSSIDKMRRGIALQDSDREPWLKAIVAMMAQPGSIVASCSALRRRYRDILRAVSPAPGFVHIAITQEQALERVRSRFGHYMPPTLVASQFDALEPPQGESDAFTVSALWSIHEQVHATLAWLQRRAVAPRFGHLPPPDAPI